MDKEGKRKRFQRAQARKRDDARLSEIQRLKQQVEGLQKELNEKRDPFKQKIEQLETQLKDARKEIQHLELKLHTKMGQVEYYTSEIDKLKGELSRYKDAENAKKEVVVDAKTEA